MKLIRTEDAVGQVLCHDLTQIIPGVVKGPRFRKGHIVAQEDIPVLLSMGKDQLYVWEKDDTVYHENEGAEILCQVCQGENMIPSEVKEGKIELTAACKGDKLLGTRVIPLVIKKEKMELVKKTAGEKPLCQLLPYRLKKAGIVTTGNEVFYGRIQDKFTPVVKKKLEQYGIQAEEHIIVGDEKEKITEAILELKARGCELIIATGGMSVDPDDQTPGAIKESGAQVVTYGAPVLPGAMFCLAYFPDGTPVMGLPGCVMYAKTTIFDLVLPKTAAGIQVSRKEITRLGNGGLCLGCEECRWPDCGFGTG